MNEEKVRNIIESMNGITYAEWEKLKMSIEERFRTEANNHTRKMQIASPEEIVSAYKKNFDLR